jgi:hypothetical protein
MFTFDMLTCMPANVKHANIHAYKKFAYMHECEHACLHACLCACLCACILAKLDAQHAESPGKGGEETLEIRNNFLNSFSY